MSQVELHFHLLPAIDDGPASLADSVALARAAVADGTRTVTTTPHVHANHVLDPREIPTRVQELVARLRVERVPLEVLPGGELAHDMVATLSGAELELIAHGPPGRRWVLLEAPFDGLDASFTEAADELRSRGFAILLAHPERAAPTESGDARLAHELALGSAVQLTAASLLGESGERARTVALRLLRTAPLAVIASDAHGAARPPALRRTVAALEAAGERSPQRHCGASARGLLDGGLARGRSVLAA
ncbi:MAG TPA: CpsB/CapC family capsule biosynthesis tyrosine phosphatase [Solirubrobacteraceae bacterium]|nr:CpsB/CapC family capsule biosynthesis tyrosine phosphatase [Solirubrobacteraceae bacterium]